MLRDCVRVLRLCTVKKNVRKHEPRFSPRSGHVTHHTNFASLFKFFVRLATTMVKLLGPHKIFVFSRAQ